MLYLDVVSCYFLSCIESNHCAAVYQLVQTWPLEAIVWVLGKTRIYLEFMNRKLTVYSDMAVWPDDNKKGHSMLSTG